MISIVIPNYNKFDLLEKCIKSLFAQTNIDFEIIVVDNGSTEKKERLPDDPRVKFIWQDNNLGFSKAVNIGIKEAKGEYIALINNDTELAVDWIDQVYRAFEGNKEAMFITSRIMSFQERDIFDDVGNVILFSGKAYKVGNGEKDSGQYNQQRYIFGASGAASVYKRDFFEIVGFFDEDFFAYLEDVDLSFRANLLGIKCLYVPEAVVYHVGSATTGSRYNKFTVFHLAQNTINLIIKDYPTKFIFKSILNILAHIISLQVFFTLKGFGLDFIKGIISGLKMSRIMLAKRREIINTRIINDLELEKLFKENRESYKKSKANRKK